jgi:hypothetical protein
MQKVILSQRDGTHIGQEVHSSMLPHDVWLCFTLKEPVIIWMVMEEICTSLCSISALHVRVQVFKEA